VAEEQARVRAAQSTTTSAAAPAAPATPHLPITWGQQLAFTAAAKSALARLGIVARGPTDAEIVQFAQGGLDAEAISDYYSFLPEFVAHNPGLPYGLSAEQYRQSVSGYGAAFRSILGRDIGAPPAPRNRAQRDYADDVRRAEKWDESDPERGNALRKAEADRADAFRELAESEGVARRTVELENQKAALKAKYPYADVNAIRGETVEAMEDAAKASHAHTEAAVKAQQEADRAARRADTRAAWTGGAGTRVGLPGGEIQQPTSV